MAYDSEIWCHCITSKINADQHFLYKDTNDKVADDAPTVFPSKTEAEIEAEKYDRRGLPLFPGFQSALLQDEFPIGFYSSSDGETYTQIPFPQNSTQLINILTVEGRTSVPTFDVSSASQQDIEAAKAVKNKIKTIYQVADKLIIALPSQGYINNIDDFTLLLMNINFAFKINLPIKIGTYLYNKDLGIWEKQTP